MQFLSRTIELSDWITYYKDSIQEKSTSTLIENQPWLKNYLKCLNFQMPLRDLESKIEKEEFSPFVANQKWVRQYQKAERLYKPSQQYLSDLYKERSVLSMFIDLVEPFTNHSIKKFNQKIQTHFGPDPQYPFDTKYIFDQLNNKLAATLFDIVHKTLVLEINVARLNNSLQGDTAEERFHDFISQIRSKSKRDQIFAEYPVIVRKVIEFGNLWVNDSFLFLKRLLQDWEQIKITFGIKDMNHIAKIWFNSGDRHNGGQAVSIIAFGKETSQQRVVYKPRNLDTDIAFQEFLNWYNKNSNTTTKLKTLNILNRKNYGWMEYVEYAPCSNKEELANYYRRTGQILALLYSINATDFHFENLIAAGEHPVLIDLESLFHPPQQSTQPSASQSVQNIINDSVLRIQILPFKMYFGSEVVDLSALSNPELQNAPTMLWHAEGTDEIRIIRGRVNMGTNNNVPTLTGGDFNKLEYQDYIISAFKTTYQFLQENLLNKDNILKVFNGCYVRILFRPTETYAQLLRASLHPDHLRSQMDADILFSRLWDKSEEEGASHAISSAEKIALLRLDIPIFQTKPNSRHLWSEGRIVVKNHFKRTGMSEVKSKIARMSQKDCNLQMWLIRASLASTRNLHEIEETSRLLKGLTINIPQNTSSIEAAVNSIAQKLRDSATICNSCAQWPGVILSQGVYDVKPLMLDLYSGIPGVTIFLSALHRFTKKKEYLDLYTFAMNTLLSQIERYLNINFTQRMGAFDGWAGILYSLLLSSQISGKKDERLSSSSTRIVHLILNNLDKIVENDIISGKAGVLLVLCRFYSQCPSQEIEVGIRKLIQLLKDSALTSENGGINWADTHSQLMDHGFGHGISGVIYSLLEARKICARKICNSLISDALISTRDFPTKTDHQASSVYSGWCKPDSGLGIGRLVLSYEGFVDLKDNLLNLAIENSAIAGSTANLSLCHGESGQLDFLLLAAEKVESVRKEVFHKALEIAQDVSEEECDYGVGSELFNPGLMVGASGVGYQLLRALDPQTFPSILLLKTR